MPLSEIKKDLKKIYLEMQEIEEKYPEEGEILDLFAETLKLTNDCVRLADAKQNGTFTTRRLAAQ